MEPKIFFEKLVRTVAVVVPVSESAGYALSGSDADELELVSHIRPGGGSEQEIAGALKAFSDIVKGALSRKQDLAALVGQPKNQDAPVYCLVHVMRFDSVPRYAVSIITRCKTPQEAGIKVGLLGRISDIWQDMLPVEKSAVEKSVVEKLVADEVVEVASPTDKSPDC